MKDMAAKKRKGTESCHRYPTRLKLARHTSLSLSQRICSEDKTTKEKTHILNLLREITFNILCLIPANDLHKVVRYVCKQWNDVVSDPVFVRVHSQMSSTGFLIQEGEEIQQAYYTELDKDKLEVANVQIPLRARIRGSCNGLVLLHDLTNTEIFHVMSLVTKVKVTLPPVVGHARYKSGASIAVDSSGHYKVVQFSSIDGSEQVCMRIFTLGVDKAWRFIDLHGIPMRREVRYALLYRPLFIAGFFFWYNTWDDFLCFAMDVDTETIYPLSGPTGISFHGGGFLNMGTSLGVYTLGEIHTHDIRVWKLTDIRFCEWTELAGVNFKAMVNRVGEKLYPGKSIPIPVTLIDGILWFYRSFGHDKWFVIGHNIANESFVYFPVKMAAMTITLFPHLRTLVSPKNC